MAWKPKHLLGKILKGVAIGAAAVGGAALLIGTGGAAAPAVATGAGLFGKIIGVTAKVVKGTAGAVYKGVSKVAKAGANLVSGLTADQRAMIKEEKAETRADLQKLTTIEKLINAGATVAEAAAKVGVPISALKGLFGVPSDAQAEQTELQQPVIPEPITAGKGCLVTTILLFSALAGYAALFLILLL